MPRRPVLAVLAAAAVAAAVIGGPSAFAGGAAVAAAVIGGPSASAGGAPACAKPSLRTGEGRDAAQGAGAALVPLAVRAAEGALHRFLVEVAADPRSREKGLMFRESLAPDSGMLFLYGPERAVAFWMKDTRLPLDLLFLRADGRIARIARDAVPFSLDPIPSGVPVLAVLEVAAGTARRLGLREGDVVLHPAFGNAAR